MDGRNVFDFQSIATQRPAFGRCGPSKRDQFVLLFRPIRFGKRHQEFGRPLGTVVYGRYLVFVAQFDTTSGRILKIQFSRLQKSHAVG